MKIVIIQNTDKDFWPMFDVKNGHLEAIREVTPQAEILIIKDTEIVGDKLREAEVILTTPFSLITLSSVMLRNEVVRDITSGLYSSSTTKVGTQNDKKDKLRWIHLTSAGVDSLPDSIKNSDILVTNSSGVHPIPISEHVFAFILIFARGIHILYRNQIEKAVWSKNYQVIDPKELPNQTIGIVGFGNIGQEIGRLAKLFGIKVLIVTSKQGNLDQLLKESDYVVDCLPSAPTTINFFDYKKFSKMKKTAVFINIGRGKTVDEQALIKALKEEIIAGAGLDVTSIEPLPKSSPLWKLKNVIITSHTSGWTPYYMDRVIEIFCKNLKVYLNKKNMPNLIDKAKGY